MIPNICHFVFGFKEQKDEFLFCYYLAVYSAYIVNKPEKIIFYYHHEPYGDWWEKLKNIPVVELIKIPIPTHIGEKEIKSVEKQRNANENQRENDENRGKASETLENR